MRERNKAPWNPPESIEIEPIEYERQVVKWLRTSGKSVLEDFSVKHRQDLTGPGGTYEFDAIANFTVFGGALITVLVECKRYSSPVEREKVLALSAKIRDVGAHKAMIFSTSGFQSGAIEYAATQGIATIAFLDGKFAYFTRSAIPTVTTPPPGLPRYVGNFIQLRSDVIHVTVISDGHTVALGDWLSQ